MNDLQHYYSLLLMLYPFPESCFSFEVVKRIQYKNFSLPPKNEKTEPISGEKGLIMNILISTLE